ncbi:MAG: hypothetical protein IKW74_00080 [Thermoguttaceae bacterium]|nr:hypothetical protein [Thermoguttaceae bacterium]
MKKSLTPAKTGIQKFHNNKKGMEVLQVVLIIALAAIVGLAIVAIGQKIVTWSNDKVSGKGGITDSGTTINVDNNSKNTNVNPSLF